MPILQGFEEIELVSIVDILRRAGLIVVLAGRNKSVIGAHIVLGKAGVLKNKFSCYPSCEDSIESSAKYCAEKVVIDENIITANGPASAALFALAIVEYLLGREKRDEVAKELLLD